MDIKLLGAGDLIENSWIICRKNYKKLLTISFWMFLPTVLATVVFLAARLLQINDIISAAIVVVVSLPAYLAQFLATIVFVLAIDSVLRGEDFEPRKLAEVALKKIWPVLLVASLTALAALGGFLLLIIPGIIFSIWYAFSYYEVVLGDVRGLEALKKSKELVKGRFWAVLWRLAASTFFWSIVVWLFMSTIFLLIQALTQPFRSVVASEPWATLLASLLELVSNAVQAAATPLFAAIGVLMYRALQTTATPKEAQK